MGPSASLENNLGLDDIQPSCIIDFCHFCGFMKTHSDNNRHANHYTCICFLLETATICCIDGYSNLLDNIPSLSLYSPLPQGTTDDYFNGLSMGFVITSKNEFLDMVHKLQDIKMRALSQQPHTRHAFLPIIFCTDV